MKVIKIAFFISILFISCEKNIEFKTNSTDEIIVVDGNIEENEEPYIVLTKSLNFFANFNTQIAANSFIHNATITLTDGEKTSVLTEREVPIGLGYSLFYYTNDSLNITNKIIGKQGKNYNLKIATNGVEYTATTTIPFLTKKCDSLWWLKVANNPDTNLVNLMGKFTDPIGFGNYIRYFTKVNNARFLPGEKSAYDDQIVDGTTYSIRIDKGVDRNFPADDKKKDFFSKGDTVTLKFCNTNKSTYTFWNTWEFAYQSIGNPFATPNKVLGNISNGALGAFCGYSVQYKKIIIPK